MGIIDQFIPQRPGPFVALDISNSSVKALELSGSPDKCRVEAFASGSMQQDATGDSPVTDSAAAGRAIREVVKRAGTKQKKVAVAVNSSSVITKTINMPAELTEDEIEQQIVYEADQYIPYPVEEVSLDFQILGPADNDPDMNNILLVACRRETVNAYTAAVEAAGLTIGLVDVETYALQNACSLLTGQMPGGGTDTTVALLDFGANRTAVNIVSNNETIYTREQDFGGQQLIENIQSHYGMPADQAMTKLRNNQLDGAFNQEILPQFAARMARQIEQSLQFFFSASDAHNNVDQVMIGGGCGMLPEIDRLLEDSLQIPTVTCNPLAGATAAASAQHNYVEHYAPALMVTAGLALRSLH